jgi:hypothetical protein
MRLSLLFIFLFILSFVAFSQTDTSHKVFDTSSGKSTAAKKIDTISQKLTDTFTIPKADSEQSSIKVILAKEPSSPDNFKYIFPILTLLLGIGINKALDYFKDRKRIRRSGERWVAEIRSLEIPIKSQIASLQSFKTEIEKEKFQVPEMEIYPILNGEIFKSLDKADLIKYIESFKGNKYDDAVLASNRVHGYVNILASHHDALKAKLDDFLKNTSAHTTSFSRHLQALMRAFGNYGVALEEELNQDPINNPRYQPIYQLFNQHIIPFMSSGEYDVYALERDFFIPLIQILGHLRLDKKMNDMADAVSACLAEIKGMKMEKGYLTENVKTLITRYENDLNELPSVVKEIRK